jgi:hypothetical protein
MNAEISKIAWEYVDLVLMRFNFSNLCVTTRTGSSEGRYFIVSKNLSCNIGYIIDKRYISDVINWDMNSFYSGCNVDALYEKFGSSIIIEPYQKLFNYKRGRQLMSIIQRMHDNPKMWNMDGMKKEHKDRLMVWMRKHFPLDGR